MKLIPLLLVIVTLSAAALAQADPPTARVSWERYLDSDRKVSVNLPKMPIKVENIDVCRELVRDAYYAYAEGVVYEFTVVYRKKNNIPCPTKVPFSDITLANQLEELRTPIPPFPRATPQAPMESTEQVSGISSYKFESSNQTQWLIPEMNKGRWVELAVHHRRSAKVDTSRFIASLSFDSREGKDIGDGADATIGDIGVKNDSAEGIKADPAQSDSLMVIAKPRAKYTEEARRNNVTGTVRLKLTLLSNGTVGNVEPVTTLKYGLTEQAVDAARKVVFIPRTVNGTRVTSVVTFEYGFSIY